MLQSAASPERTAKHGEKRICVKVEFWTEKLAREAGKIRPKNARTSGTVRMQRNDAHGIKTGNPIPFLSLMEIPSAIEKLLIREGVTLHLNPKMKKYVRRTKRG